MKIKNDKKLLFVELNEINFDVIDSYIRKGHKLTNFKKVVSLKSVTTTSENKYDEIEPWIQWHSIHTGLTYAEHKIFRLGDGIYCQNNGIYKDLEDSGLRVGAISPMNLKNNLKNPNFFIPDPWTQTKSDNDWWSRKISKVLNQIVNDNASSSINFSSLIFLFAALVRFSKIKNYFTYINLATTSLIKKPWRKALFLDLFLSDLNISLIKKHKPNYSSLFLNGGAHIQHHYFFNSKVINENKNPKWYVDDEYDPFLEMLVIYDRILGSIINLNIPFIIATGMSQTTNDTKEYYYRLKDHNNFLEILDIKFTNVLTRMSRDFEVNFENNSDRDTAYNRLKNLKEEKTQINIFDEIEVRDRGLFITLTFSREMKNGLIVENRNKKINLKDHVVFVAIKNGKHQSKGYAFFSKEFEAYSPKDKNHVKNLYNSIIEYFSISIQNSRIE